MKRLLDESTDELTRSLLAAGVEHRPPSGNKGQVIVALGAGSALGLFSSNAFAWLGTTAGKVTAAGAAVGVAGAVFAVAPHWADDSGALAQLHRAQLHQAQLHQAQASARAEAAQPLAALPSAEAMSGTAQRSVSPAVAPSAASAGVVDDTAEQRVAGSRSGEARVPREGRASSKLARSSERRKKAAGKRKAVTSAPSELRGEAEGEEPAAAGALAAAGQPEPAIEGTSASSSPALDAVQLDSEVRLVDDMHSAARRHDRVALGRFVELYRESFPDGQLKKEVAEFAARLERSDAP